MDSLGFFESRVRMHALAKGRPSEGQRENSRKRDTVRMERACTWNVVRRSFNSTSCTYLRTDEEEEGKKTLGAHTRAPSLFTKVPLDDSYSLGLCYEKGIGVALKMWRATSYFKQASDAGDVREKCDLGVCYQTGQGEIGMVRAPCICIKKWRMRAIPKRSGIYPHVTHMEMELSAMFNAL